MKADVKTQIVVGFPDLMNAWHVRVMVITAFNQNVSELVDVNTACVKANAVSNHFPIFYLIRLYILIAYILATSTTRPNCGIAWTCTSRPSWWANEATGLGNDEVLKQPEEKKTNSAAGNANTIMTTGMVYVGLTSVTMLYTLWFQFF